MQLLAKVPGDRIQDAMTVRDACIQIGQNLADTNPVPVPGLDQPLLSETTSPPSIDDDAPDALTQAGDTLQLHRADGSRNAGQLDIAPTVLPADTVNTRIGTELSARSKNDLVRRDALRRNLALAAASAVVASLIAGLGVLLFAG